MEKSKVKKKERAVLRKPTEKELNSEATYDGEYKPGTFTPSDTSLRKTGSPIADFGVAGFIEKSAQKRKQEKDIQSFKDKHIPRAKHQSKDAKEFREWLGGILTGKKKKQ